VYTVVSQWCLLDWSAIIIYIYIYTVHVSFSSTRPTYFILLINIYIMSDLVGRVLTPSVEGQWFEPRSGEVKD